MNAERWSQGMPLAEYIETSRARGRILRRLQDVKLSDEVKTFFQNLSAPLHVMILTEDWCPAAPPALAVLTQCNELSNGRLDARVFKREANPDLMDQYLKEGRYRSIPVIAFFDEQFRPLGDIREKPTLPEWENMSTRERHVAELRMGWSEVWGRAYMAIISGEARKPDSDGE